MGQGKKISDQQKQELAKLGKKHKLSLMILYGSQVKGKTHQQSDVDIAVYKKGGISPGEYLEIYSEIMRALENFDVDVKNLRDTNPLFKFFVTNDGVLLFGDALLFAEMKATAYQDYFDSKSLFVLEEKLNKKGIEELLGRYA